MSRRHIFTAVMWLIVALPVFFVVGCAGGGSDLTARLTAANLLAGSAAQSLAVAAEAGQIDPGSETATAILLTLGAVETGLDGAGAALRAGLPEMAGENLAAAESQLLALQPLLPGGQ